MLIPRKAYLTSGTGFHVEPLVAFELALRDAGIAAQNLVSVSSILPPTCELIEREVGERHLHAGQILHVVMSRDENSSPGHHLGAAIGIAVPRGRTTHGFIAEAHTEGSRDQELRSHAEDLATTMLASTLGLEVDETLSAAKRAQALRTSELFESSGAISAHAEVGYDGRSACAVAACVFIMDWMIT